MLTPVLHIMLDEQGTPRTVNRRVKVSMIIQKHLTGGLSIEATAEHYTIELADVYAALAYYYDNRPAMDAEFARAEAEVMRVGISGAHLREKIARRMGLDQS